VHVFDRGLYSGDVRGRYRLTFHAEAPSGSKVDTARTVVTMRDPVELDDDERRLVSPNGDGRQDRLRIGYDLEQVSRIRAVVRAVSLQTGASTVVSQARLGRLKAGRHAWVWSPAKGLADGSYTVTLVAAPPADRPGAGRASVGVTVDTVAPDATMKRSRTTVYPTTTLFADEIRFQFGEDVQISSLDASVRRPDARSCAP
jgi:hypothetical protein